MAAFTVMIYYYNFLLQWNHNPETTPPPVLNDLCAASKLRSTRAFSRAESYHPKHSGTIRPEFAFPAAVNNHRQEMLQSILPICIRMRCTQS